MNSPPLPALPAQIIPPIRPTLADTSRGTGSSGGSSISGQSSYTSTTSSSYSSSTHSYSSGGTSGYINGENPYSKLVIMDSSNRKDKNFPFPFVSSLGSTSIELDLPSLSTNSTSTSTSTSTPSTTSSSSRSSSYTTSPTTGSNSSTKSLPNSRSSSFIKDNSEHLQTLRSLREEEGSILYQQEERIIAEADFNARSLVGKDEEPEESPFFSSSPSTSTSISTSMNYGTKNEGKSPRRGSMPNLPSRTSSISESYHSSLPPISTISSPSSPSTTPQAFSSTRELPSSSSPSSSSSSSSALPSPPPPPPLLSSTSSRPNSSSTLASVNSNNSGSSTYTSNSNSNSSSSGLGSNRPWVRDLLQHQHQHHPNNLNNSNYSTDSSSLYSSGSASGSGWSNKNLGIGLILGKSSKIVLGNNPSVGEYKTLNERELGDRDRDGDGDGGGDEIFAVVGGGGIEFLDPRPSPPGAQLQVLRPENDRDPICIKVVLPGFSLDHIQVAMRRGHRVHIVADSWGEGGGHFEKLVSLGADASSAAPRAEFDGVNLLVWVQRRYFPTSSPSTKSSSVPPYSPNPSIASIDSSSSSFSPSSVSEFDLSTSRTIGSEPEEEPITTRSTENPNSKKNSKTLTGREGAKIAAKLAKELSCQRAKEAAKSLPKLPTSANIGRRFAPGCDYTSNSLGSVRNFVSGMGLGRTSSTSKTTKEGSNSGDSEAGSNRSASGGSPPSTSSTSRPGMPRRTSSYGKGQTTHGEVTKDIDTSNASLSSSPSNSSTSSATPRAGTTPVPGSSFPTSSSSYTSISNRTSLCNPVDTTPPSNNSARPKLRGSNVTLRPSGTTSFFEAAIGAFTHSHSNSHSNSSSNITRSRSNSVTKSEVGEAELKTPRDERGEFRFTSLNSSQDRKYEEEVVGRAQ